MTYALAAPFVWVAGLTEFDVLPTLAFRLVNAASMAVGVVLIGLLAPELSREGGASGSAPRC